MASPSPSPITRFSANTDSGSATLTARSAAKAAKTPLAPTASGSSAATPRKIRNARIASSGKASASARPRSRVACWLTSRPATDAPPRVTARFTGEGGLIRSTAARSSLEARSVAVTIELLPSREGSGPPTTATSASARRRGRGVHGGGAVRAATHERQHPGSRLGSRRAFDLRRAPPWTASRGRRSRGAR